MQVSWYLRQPLKLVWLPISPRGLVGADIAAYTPPDVLNQRPKAIQIPYRTQAERRIYALSGTKAAEHCVATRVPAAALLVTNSVRTGALTRYAAWTRWESNPPQSACKADSPTLGTFVPVVGTTIAFMGFCQAPQQRHHGPLRVDPAPAVAYSRTEVPSEGFEPTLHAP